MNFAKYVKKNRLGKIIKKKSFKDITTIKTGGRIKYYYCPNQLDSLALAMRFIYKKRMSYLIIGNGSNILASDKKYKGVVVTLSSIPQKLVFEDTRVIASASQSINGLLNVLAEKGLENLEFLSGIPGTIGGAVTMNAGAFNKQIANFFLYADVLKADGTVERIFKNEMDFKYRSSNVSKKTWIVLEVALEVKNSKHNLQEIINDYREKKRKSQPVDYPNCGSIFKNPPEKKAWELIANAGLKGKGIGGAMFSLRHANFIINVGMAKSCQIQQLLLLAQDKVFKMTGYHLEKEIVMVNF